MKKMKLIHAFARFIADAKQKKYIAILIMGFFIMTAFADPPLASQQEIGMFKNSKTCVVLENGSLTYNVYIKDAVQKYWKITEYEFIDQNEFQKRRFDSKYSFLVLLKGVFDKDPDGVSYNYLSLVLGSANFDMTKMPELCSIPLSYSVDKDIDYGYAIPAIIKFIQIDVKNLDTKRLLIAVDGLKYYNWTGSFKDKILLLNKDMMAPDANTAEKIKTVYPHIIKLLTSSEIKTELAISSTNTIFNFHVGPTENSGAGKCFEMIFDTDGNLYYYNYRKITNDNKDGFNLDDFHHIR